MQIERSNGNVVEKIFHDKTGRLIRAKFFVYESAGRVKARLLTFDYINALSSAVFNLAGSIKTFAKKIDSSFQKSFVSRFIVKEAICYSGSKPRAPTFN